MLNLEASTLAISELISEQPLTFITMTHKPKLKESWSHSKNKMQGGKERSEQGETPGGTHDVVQGGKFAKKKRVLAKIEKNKRLPREKDYQVE